MPGSSAPAPRAAGDRQPHAAAAGRERQSGVGGRELIARALRREAHAARELPAVRGEAHRRAARGALRSAKPGARTAARRDEREAREERDGGDAGHEQKSLHSRLGGMQAQGAVGSAP